MRGSGWLVPGVATVLWLAAVVAPAIAMLAAGATGAAAADAAAVVASDVTIRPMGTLLVETAAYAIAIAIGAALFGWAPGRALGGALAGRAGWPIAALMLVPMCLPAYVVFYAWWQAWPGDSVLHAWAVRHEMVPALRQATLVVGLLCWSWALVSWCVAGAVVLRSDTGRALLMLDGAGPWRRLAAALRDDGRGLLIGGLLVFLVVFNNTTCFDLAQVFTFGNELRAKDALGATPGALLAASAPAIAIVAVGVVVAWLRLGMRPTRNATTRPARPGAAIWTAAAVLWSVSVLLPLGLFMRNLAWRQVDQFFALYGDDLLRSLTLAVAAGGLAAVVAVGLAFGWLDHRRWVRVVAHVQAIGWMVAALVPATLVGAGLEAAYNQPGPAGAIYGHPAILVLGYLARGAFAGALLARWVSLREPRAFTDLRRTDGAGTLAGAVRAARPQIVALVAATGALVAVLAAAEIPVTARVHPPGSNPLAVSILNDMHYQRPQSVLTAVAMLMAAAIGASVLVVSALAIVRSAPARRSLVALTLVLAGCDDGEGGGPLRTRLVFGTTGTAPGQFSYPRCISIDTERAILYIVDKTARVQAFNTDGTPRTQWSMPAKENGKPTGVSVAPDGRVFVADTHYHRIIAYDGVGRETLRFGRYGEGPGEFIYPTDVAFGPEGRLYVAEYGGHDRIQVFDDAGTYLFEFGRIGEGHGELNRPQSILFNADGDELFIADSCNHRIVVVNPVGDVLRTFGTPGRGPGEMHYPYGLAFAADGTLLVAEFGNNRIQRFDADGTPRGLFGRLGAAEGELRYPWGVGVHERTVFVLDSGNDRVQAMRAP